MRILIVGAGFAGAVYARTLAEQGHQITMIDRRDHIGGNAYDYIDATGVRIHKYGPHLFHTNNEAVVAWIQRFGEFVPYEHAVTVRHGSKRLPMPISRATFETYYDRKFQTKSDLEAFLQKIVVAKANPSNAADYLYGLIGVELTDILFRPYTKKMWGHELEDMDAAVVRRVSVQLDYEFRYFPKDRFQFLPSHGYEAIFQNILDHDKIKIYLNMPYSEDAARQFDFVFSSAAIDEHFGSMFGELPYRSIRFHHHQVSTEQDEEAATSVVNYSDAGPFTRETRWHRLPQHHVFKTGSIIKTVEEPCDFRLNHRERYYPISDAAGDNHRRYTLYRAEADKAVKLKFIGRCGMYQYLDMHQVINQSLVGATQWLDVHGPAG